MTRSNSTDESPSVDQQRSEYEQFSLHVCQGGVGYVNVRNLSYGEESGSHIYSVEVKDGEPVSCSCPHHKHRGARCKHQRVVQQNPLVLASANVTSGGKPLTDGGTTVEQSTEDDEPETETCDRCPKPLSEVHETHRATTITTEGEELCPDCADARTGEEIGFGTNDGTDSDDKDTGRVEPVRSEPADFGGGEGGMDEL